MYTIKILSRLLVCSFLIFQAVCQESVEVTVYKLSAEMFRPISLEEVEVQQQTKASISINQMDEDLTEEQFVDQTQNEIPQNQETNIEQFDNNVQNHSMKQNDLVNNESPSVEKNDEIYQYSNDQTQQGIQKYSESNDQLTEMKNDPQQTNLDETISNENQLANQSDQQANVGKHAIEKIARRQHKSTNHDSTSNIDENIQIKESNENLVEMKEQSQTLTANHQMTQENAQPTGDCIIIFSQCNFKGESMKACDSLSELDSFEPQIRSIYVPEGLSVTFYDEEEYGGENHMFDKSQKCLLKPLLFTQLYQKQKQKSGKLSHQKLRKNKK